MGDYSWIKQFFRSCLQWDSIKSNEPPYFMFNRYPRRRKKASSRAEFVRILLQKFKLKRSREPNNAFLFCVIVSFSNGGRTEDVYVNIYVILERSSLGNSVIFFYTFHEYSILSLSLSLSLFLSLSLPPRRSCKKLEATGKKGVLAMKGECWKRLKAWGKKESEREKEREAHTRIAVAYHRSLNGIRSKFPITRY